MGMISSFVMPLIDAEAVAASIVALLASAITFAYLADWIGLQIAPFPILILSLAVAIIAFAVLRRQAARGAAALCGFSVSVLGTCAWFLWPARVPRTDTEKP